MSSWWCPTPEDHVRFVDMHRRVGRTMGGVVALIVGGSLVMQPWLPVASTVVLITTVILGLVVNGRLATRRPELALVATVMGCQLGVTAAIVLADLQHSGGVMLLLPLTIAPASVFPRRAVAALTAATGACMVVAELGFDGSAVLDNPPVLGFPLLGLVACAMIISTLRESDVEHRTATRVDRLTGMQNRSALIDDAHALERGSAAGRSIAVLLADIDHFKTINDELGHLSGDTVLCAVADRLVQATRGGDTVYRSGGEEFAVILRDCVRTAVAAPVLAHVG